MRVKMMIDGATTEEVRQLTVALHRAGLTGELKVQCEGPACWGAVTPPLRPHQLDIVLREMKLS